MELWITREGPLDASGTQTDAHGLTAADRAAKKASSRPDNIPYGTPEYGVVHHYGTGSKRFSTTGRHIPQQLLLLLFQMHEQEGELSKTTPRLHLGEDEGAPPGRLPWRCAGLAVEAIVAGVLPITPR